MGNKDVGPGSLEFTHGLKTHIVMSKAGALGIGTGIPMAGTSLHVKGPAMFGVGKGKGKLVISTPNGSPGMSFFDNNGFRRMDFEIHSSGVSFTNTGFLGVGTKSPKSKFHIYDPKKTMMTLSRSGKESSQAYISYAGAYVKVGTTVADGIQFDVNKITKATLHPNGNFGVQTTIPKSQLQVGKSTHLYEAGDRTTIAGNAFFDGAKFKYTVAGGAAGIQMKKDGSLGVYTSKTGSANMQVADFAKARLVVTGTGKVGIGTESPDTSLHIASSNSATLKSHGAFMIGKGKSKKNVVFDARSMQARANGQPSKLRLNPFGGDVAIFADSTKPGRRGCYWPCRHSLEAQRDDSRICQECRWSEQQGGCDHYREGRKCGGGYLVSQGPSACGR